MNLVHQDEVYMLNGVRFGCISHREHSRRESMLRVWLQCLPQRTQNQTPLLKSKGIQLKFTSLTNLLKDYREMHTIPQFVYVPLSSCKNIRKNSWSSSDPLPILQTPNSLNFLYLLGSLSPHPLAHHLHNFRTSYRCIYFAPFSSSPAHPADTIFLSLASISSGTSPT